MQELISQLTRLYLPLDAAPPEGLARQFEGGPAVTCALARDGTVRAVAVPIGRQGERSAWERLCDVANALQGELGLPAPAVSIDGATGFCLWLSFDTPVPAGTAQRFVELLCAAYCADATLPAQGVQAPVALPPFRHAGTGKWAAFIHPGMGASFADEPGLDMPPPAAGQAAFLQGLDSIDAARLQHALEQLAPAPAAPARPAARADTDGLLLKDATLEDIVRHLHAKNIEPTFRHLLNRRPDVSLPP